MSIAQRAECEFQPMEGNTAMFSSAHGHLPDAERSDEHEANGSII